MRKRETKPLGGIKTEKINNKEANEFISRLRSYEGNIDLLVATKKVNNEDDNL